MKLVTPFIVVFLLSAGSIALAQEQNSIAGVVRDDVGSPVPGATVFVKGTSQVVTTDVEGQFRLAPSKDLPFSIQVNFVGYKPQYIDVYELSGELLEVTLKTDN